MESNRYDQLKKLLALEAKQRLREEVFDTLLDGGEELHLSTYEPMIDAGEFNPHILLSRKGLSAAHISTRTWRRPSDSHCRARLSYLSTAITGESRRITAMKHVARQLLSEFRANISTRFSSAPTSSPYGLRVPIRTSCIITSSRNTF